MPTTSIAFSCMGFSFFVKSFQFSSSLASQTMNIYCGSLPLWRTKKICEAFTWNEAIRQEHYWNLAYALASAHTSPYFGNALVFHLYPRSRWQMWTKMLFVWLEAPSENRLVQFHNFFSFDVLWMSKMKTNYHQPHSILCQRISLMLQRMQTSFILSHLSF
jgi:hypothetical protein